MPTERVSNRGHCLPKYQCPITGRLPYRLSCASFNYFGDHWHSEVELLYLLPGSSDVRVVVEGQPYILNPREMIMIPGASVHRVEGESGDNQLFVLEFGYPLLGDDFRPFTEKRFTEPFYSFELGTNETLGKIEPLIDELCTYYASLTPKSCKSDDTASAILRMKINASIFSIAALLLEGMPFAETTAAVTPIKHSHQTIQTVIYHIRDHFAEPITVIEAASMAGYEKTRFCRLFKDMTGLTFHKYLTGLRLDAAYPLLRETELSVSSIGKSVGIPSIKTFSRLVRERYGMSPIEIRGGNADDTTSEHK